MANQSLSEPWLEVGTIVAPLGLKGELKVKSNSDFPERFEQPGKRWLQSPRQEQPQAVELLAGRYIPSKDLYVVCLEGVENREQAEELRGYKLLVPKSDRPPLEEDEYHVADLINLEVYNQITGEKIGIVVDILVAGNDLLEVKLESALSAEDSSSETKVLIPFVKAIVPVVDLDKRFLTVNLPKGLLESTQF